MLKSLLSRSRLVKNLRYKTPCFVIAKKEIAKNYLEFEKRFPGSGIFYAMKANSETAVLETVYSLGGGFEAASVGELNLLKLLNIPPDRIIFGTAVKSAESIKTFHEYGVSIFAFDAFSELEKIAANAPGAKVYARMSVNDAGSVFKFSEKFGADINTLAPLLLRAKELGLVPYGISFHVGSQAGNPMAWSQAILTLRPVVQTLEAAGIKLEILDIGGGYPCNYPSVEEEITLKEIAKHIHTALKKLPYQPKLFLEPGRGIVATSSVLITEIIARVERGQNTWLFLDAGVYNALFETMAYQGSTRYKVTSQRHSFSAGEKMFALAGPTGDSPDVITREAHLPEDMEVGDRLIFHNVGAYSMSVTSTFNGFQKPAVHVI
jgi:ornithine decarboxylase